MTAIVPPGCWDDPRKHLDTVLDNPWYRAITVMNSTIVEATADFYRLNGISPALMPITASSVSSPMGLGSDSLPVSVQLMGERTYLADSMQFQLEFMLRQGLRGAYYIMPTFRGEDPDETHLNQFFHSEAEIAGGIEDVMDLVESYVRHLCGALLAPAFIDHLHTIAGQVDHVAEVARRASFPRVTVAEALEIVDPKHVEERLPGVPTITRGGERQLIEHFGGIVWLTNPPALSVPFYQAVNPDGTARCADLLFGVGEVVGCGERHATREDVDAALREHQVDPAEYEWYLLMKKFAPMCTAGFGLGVERFQLWALCIADIRDLHVMPRLKGIASWL
jgi:asparaginyl-tRNA synthetase